MFSVGKELFNWENNRNLAGNILRVKSGGETNFLGGSSCYLGGEAFQRGRYWGVLYRECRSSSSSVIAFDGSAIQCKRRGRPEITVGEEIITVDAIVVESIAKGVDIVLGLDAITQLGGITIHNGMITFGHVQIISTACADPISELADANNACNIKYNDFLAKFNGEFWTVESFWKNQMLPMLTNTIGLYKRGLEGRKKEQFEKAVDQWIEEGILIPWNGVVENGIPPLMAAEQPKNGKVPPVLDYRELNKSVSIILVTMFLIYA